MPHHIWEWIDEGKLILEFIQRFFVDTCKEGVRNGDGRFGSIT
jgi:hypothetical protein